MRDVNAIFSSVSILLIVLLMAASCVSRSGPSADSIAQGYANASPESEVNEINSKLLTRSAPSHSSASDYIIGPSDLIEVKVFESEKLTTTERVDANGYINLPLIDNVQVNGLTPIRAEEKIEMLLKDGGYINNPHVSIFVLEHKSNTVSVLGYVNEPGNYELIGKVTLLDALAFAKGLDKDAGTTVYIARERNGTQEKIMVDLNDMFERTGPSDQVNLVINSGDKIYVPEAFNIFIDGAVVKPGSYPIDSQFAPEARDQHLNNRMREAQTRAANSESMTRISTFTGASQAGLLRFRCKNKIIRYNLIRAETKALDDKDELGAPTPPQYLPACRARKSPCGPLCLRREG